eukprot:MONOS_1742.1-p1 / transcript=MONOS_1742.1 / gene=MONOS_1742 / organism=Monocercomonoides_exilis_PA203 / gene_product=unspecified product / transcript_product=unspecified product / location=Mono_scaffold00032:108702-109626(+) / protein_length=267 / sequence_SO=supercontig / SO=protein_coding / is_pseudo=false
MNEIVDEMNEEEFRSVITEQMFNKIHQMIEEKTLSLESAIVLTKHIGCCKVMKNIWNLYFDRSSLRGRFEQMIIEEEKKIEEKNKKLFTDLCECFAFLNDWINLKMRCVCVTCLLKVASVKEESEKNQKDVEIALLALCELGFYFIERELYLNEITEIIKHQQKHRNLTKLAYQSAWEFLIKRFIEDRNLEVMIANELHFAREARRELEELMRCIDWKRKGENEAKEVLVIWRWLFVIDNYLTWCALWNEELVGFLGSIVQTCSRK